MCLITIIMKRCAVVLWLCVLAAVHGRDCTVEEFLHSGKNDDHFDLTGLSDSYSGGASVRVPCNVGYVGFFKMICTDEGWIFRGQKCEARPCGHPGDAPYAEFELSKGDDFVFGSEVVYTCNRGFQMVSRQSTRRCMAEGWDGVIPVCEAIRCPAVYIDSSTQVTGDPEDATFGNVLRFSCKSTWILNGSAEMYCDEFGNWNAKPPNCIELSCAPPVIPNGIVHGNAQSYSENELLSYGCDAKYRPVNSMSPRCSKIGQRAEWIPTPQCEPIKCSLTLPPTKGTSYEPVGKSIFYPGESVTVTCQENYFIFFRRDTSKTITCQDDGRWDSPSSTCNEVICDRPRDFNVQVRYYGTPKKLHEILSYSCTSGFRIPLGYTEATCTRDGWIPNPLCEEIVCHPVSIEHAVYRNARKSVYKSGERAIVDCKGDYEGSHTITCRRYGWDTIPTCKARTCTLPTGYQEVAHFNEYEWRKVINETKKYTCQQGYNRKDGVDHATCTRDGWLPKPLCEDVCSKPTITNGFAVGPLKNNKFYFTCNENYKLSSKGWWGETSCNEGVWSNSAVCIGSKHCVNPAIPNAKELSNPRNDYENEAVIQIECEQGYTSATGVKAEIQCKDGKWFFGQQPVAGLCSLRAQQCNPPARVANAVVDIKYRKKYLSDTKVTYICRDGYIMEGPDFTIICRDGTWEKKKITCIRYCQKPVFDGEELTLTTEKHTYVNGDVIEYVCLQPSVKREGTATCVDGAWDKPLGCKGDCQEPEFDESTLTLKNMHGPNVNGAVIQYECVEQRVKRGGNATCVDGTWNKPLECKESCTIHIFDEKLHLRNMTREVIMESGTSKYISCQGGYYQPGDPASTFSKVNCNNGVITYQDPGCTLQPK